MYIPAHFAESDRAVLHEFIEKNGFGLLVSNQGGEPFASHLPFLLNRDAGPHGALIGHMAKANPQWQSAEGQSVLAIFSGPHAYISPSWYGSPLTVPTWNYVAVHAYGIFRAIHEPQALAEIVRDMVAIFELPDSTWQLDVESDFFRKLLPQIVGFRIEIERLEGKWKLNQNQPPERRKKVIAALEARGDENARAIAELIRRSV
jgi:transcriptional regulator